MPFSLGEFKRLVKAANPTFERLVKSSLHDLIAALEKKTPPASPADIARLIQQIPIEKRRKYHDALAYLQGNLLGLMPIAPKQDHAPPELQVMGPSGWQTVTVRNHVYKVYQQQHGESCGPSSVLMVLNQKKRTTAETLVRLWFKETEGADDGRVLDFSGGAGFFTIVKVLSERAKITATRRLDLVPTGSVMRCTPDAPGILRIGWTRGGGHFVVCVGTIADQMIPERVYLDPWYGVVRNPVAFFPRYDTTGGSFKQGPGRGTITHLLTTG